jgi:hypothetical protein
MCRHCPLSAPFPRNRKSRQAAFASTRHVSWVTKKQKQNWRNRSAASRQPFLPKPPQKCLSPQVPLVDLGQCTERRFCSADFGVLRFLIFLCGFCFTIKDHYPSANSFVHPWRNFSEPAFSSRWALGRAVKSYYRRTLPSRRLPRG